MCPTLAAASVFDQGAAVLRVLGNSHLRYLNFVQFRSELGGGALITSASPKCLNSASNNTLTIIVKDEHIVAAGKGWITDGNAKL